MSRAANQIRHIPEAEIETLRTDRRHHMCGFAHQRKPLASEPARHQSRKWECISWPRFRDITEKTTKPAGDRLGEFGVAYRREALGFHGAFDPDEARRTAGQRHYCKWSMRIVEFGADAIMGPAVSEIADGRGLIVTPFASLDARR